MMSGADKILETVAFWRTCRELNQRDYELYKHQIQSLGLDAESYETAIRRLTDIMEVL